MLTIRLLRSTVSDPTSPATDALPAARRRILVSCWGQHSAFTLRAEGDLEEEFLRRAFLTPHPTDSSQLLVSYDGQRGVFTPPPTCTEPEEEFLRDCRVDDPDAPELSDEELYS